jgi:DNA topoisomerase-1
MRTARTRERLQATGIRRIGTPKSGFRYRAVDGRRVSAEDLERIRRLRVPPAWREVFIARSPRERVQAIGLDAAGRWQYRYDAAHHERRAKAKFDRLLAFGAALPGLRRALRRDLAKDGLPLEKAQAAAVLLMSASALRPGAEEYARDNGTFGLATLRSNHVEIRGPVIKLCFRGKHGIQQRIEIRSRLLARLLQVMKRLPGRELLKYQGEDGQVHDIRRDHVNAYIKQAMDSRFSGRDFRTWAATLMCASALARAHGSSPSIQRAITAALRDTAGLLGNTPAVVRNSYVHPVLIDAYRQGRMATHVIARPEGLMGHRHVALSRPERALLALLRSARRRGGSLVAALEASRAQVKRGRGEATSTRLRRVDGAASVANGARGTAASRAPRAATG